MSTKNNNSAQLEQFWMDFAKAEIKDENRVQVISSGLEGESYSFAYTQNQETGYYDWAVSYSAVVPEPSTYAAILGALALGFVAYRRRK